MLWFFTGPIILLVPLSPSLPFCCFFPLQRFRRALSPTEASSAKAKAQQVPEDWDAPSGPVPAASARPPAWSMDPKARREYDRFIHASGMDQVTDIWDKSMVDDLPKVRETLLRFMSRSLVRPCCIVMPLCGTEVLPVQRYVLIRTKSAVMSQHVSMLVLLLLCLQFMLCAYFCTLSHPSF